MTTFFLKIGSFFLFGFIFFQSFQTNELSLSSNLSQEDNLELMEQQDILIAVEENSISTNYHEKTLDYKEFDTIIY